MARRHIPEKLTGPVLADQFKEAGLALLHATDEMGLNAQGAMWVYDHNHDDWRYYLITSLVDTIGRRKTYALLLDAFSIAVLPSDMSIDDVYLGSPTESIFLAISRIIHIDNSIGEFSNCTFNDVKFDGVVYRAIRHIPSNQEAKAIERKFERNLKHRSHAT